MKFHILLPYYRRPEIVIGALNSVIDSTYKNYKLSFIDDSGDESFKQTFLSLGSFKEEDYVPVLMSDKEKQSIGGSIIGKVMNSEISNYESDKIIILCDDDALFPDYLEKLNNFYTKNPDNLWSYCYVSIFNPLEESYKTSKINLSTSLNQYTTPIHPWHKVDASQVSFSRDYFIKTTGFSYPLTRNLDADIYNKLFPILGNCAPNYIIGQYKGTHEKQLGNRKNDFI